MLITACMHMSIVVLLGFLYLHKLAVPGAMAIKSCAV